MIDIITLVYTRVLHGPKEKKVFYLLWFPRIYRHLTWARLYLVASFDLRYTSSLLLHYHQSELRQTTSQSWFLGLRNFFFRSPLLASLKQQYTKNRLRLLYDDDGLFLAKEIRKKNSLGHQCFYIPILKKVRCCCYEFP